MSTNRTWIYHGVPNDYYRFTTSGLEHLFRDFSEVKVYPCGGYVNTLFSLVLLPLKPNRFVPWWVLAIPVTVLNIIGKFLDRLIYSTRLTTNLVVVAAK